MTELDIDEIAADRSSNMTFTFSLHIQNGRLGSEKRAMVARVLRKIIGGFVQQLNAIAEGLFIVELEITSPQNGTRQIDIGADQ